MDDGGSSKGSHKEIPFIRKMIYKEYFGHYFRVGGRDGVRPERENAPR